MLHILWYSNLHYSNPATQPSVKEKSSEGQKERALCTERTVKKNETKVKHSVVEK